MRKTAKYTAAQKQARLLKIKATLAHEDLYNALVAAGWFWNSKTGQWEQGKQQTSMFAGDDDTPSGVIRLRVMAHPQEITEAVRLVKTAPGMRCIETSGEYPNRRGIGVRVYLTFVRDQHEA